MKISKYDQQCYPLSKKLQNFDHLNDEKGGRINRLCTTTVNISFGRHVDVFHSYNDTSFEFLETLLN